MRLLSWNTRRLGCKSKGRMVGRSGGLVSLWRDDCFRLISHCECKNWIATILSFIPDDVDILIINVYAPQEEYDKKVLWRHIISMASSWSGPLCVVRDFNSTCTPEERLRCMIDHANMANFNSFLAEANLLDQPLQNASFTWEGGRGVIKGQQEIKSYDAQMKRLGAVSEQRALSHGEVQQLVEIRIKRRFIKRQEETKKMLSSRVQWLKLGDKNTHFFHLMSRIRCNSSYISGIQIGDSWEENPEIIKNYILNHFARTFSAPFHSQIQINWSSFGLASLSTNEFHCNSAFPSGFNSSFIVLIPKHNVPREITRMRPISLLNAPYKILAKVLANRLRSVLPRLVSCNQNAFVSSRQLLDGVMLLNEV
ncbi:hypothetical protein CTI12_AA166400 [Artemisia annua]|uniref:Reverse transcriptase domain-containing protein n=1 Tax=Artemisia annua TaxID=35608 RepID=A0A2U1PDC7_ARTAN|nr:hypothetical protein CTI12_AA166400 [Artemisia annua]